MTGLVDVGGGMRGIYGAGVMDYLLEKGFRFDYCIGVSSGSANVASFLSNQKGRNLRIYTTHSKDKRFMSVRSWLKTRSYFGLEYLYNTITNELDPIDYNVLLASKSELKVVVTNALDGKPHYFTNKDFQKDNCEVLKASCALPVICRPISIKDTLYFDGGVSDPVPIRKAIADGCDKLVVILTSPVAMLKKQEKTRRLYPLFLKKYPKIIKALGIRHDVYRDSIRYLLELEKDGKAVIISPTQKSSMSLATKKADTLKGFYKLGYEDAMKKMTNTEIQFA